MTEEQERQELLALQADQPHDPIINYRCAVIHDRMGMEHEAVPFYEAAIANGLEGEDLRGAYLGLGSTFRAIGRYAEAIATLERGVAVFPDADELVVFRAMALYNVGRHTEAVGDLLKTLAAGPGEGVERYKRAIGFYAEHLDETW